MSRSPDDDDQHRRSPSPWDDKGVFTLRADQTPSTTPEQEIQPPPRSSESDEDNVSEPWAASELTEVDDLPRSPSPSIEFDDLLSTSNWSTIRAITQSSQIQEDDDNEITYALRFTRDWMSHLDMIIPFDDPVRNEVRDAVARFSFPKGTASSPLTPAKKKGVLVIPKFNPDGAEKKRKQQGQSTSEGNVAAKKTG
ncbi:MAG: hypothetical protein M1823_003479 [Watsoniomyces obsoletus]|nr:MAG: hypothetical protein M1823_003479 [Watsoniomyces obsoletus]